MTDDLYLDIGNTNTKWKFHNNYFLESSNTFDFNILPLASTIWVSCVSSRRFENVPSNVFFIEAESKYKSLLNSYQETQTLGADRWMSMIACYEMCNKNSFITIDIGSAVTIDLVDSLGNHQGGLIIPGLQKIRETFNFSENHIENLHSLGDSTQQGWSIGTMSLIVNFINLKVNELKIKFPSAPIFISGGGFEDLKNFIQFPYSYHRNLVLDGLEYYVNNMG